MDKAIAARDKARAEKDKLIEVSKDVYWVGAVDYNVRDFHGIETLKGSSYNSYLILGENPTIVDSVKEPFAGTMMGNVRAIIDPLLVKYVVVNHAEQDHASALGAVLSECKNATVVCSAKTRDALIKIYRGEDDKNKYNTGGFFHLGLANTNHNTSHTAVAKDWNYKVIKHGETMSLGAGQTLWFFETPMMHWPESMFTYLLEERVLFSMDAFGQHIGRVGFDDQLVQDEPTGACSKGVPGKGPRLADLVEEARSYYANILMPFGKVILRTLEKFLGELDKVEIVRDEGRVLPRVLATAHGVMWRKHVGLIVELYQRWAAHTVLPKVLVLYDTMYGSTERMARAIHQGVVEYRGEDGRTVQGVILSAKEDHITRSADEALDSACIAVGSPVLNAVYLPTLGSHLLLLRGLRPEGRSGIVFGSYGWGPVGQNHLNKAMEEIGITMIDKPITVQFTPDEDVLKKCYEAGRKLAAIALEKTKA